MMRWKFEHKGKDNFVLQKQYLATSAFILANSIPRYYWSCSQFITLHFCFSFLLTLLPCSSVWSLAKDTVLHGLIQCGSFLRAVALHELLQHRSFPQGVRCGQTPAWVLHGPKFPPEILLLHVLLYWFQLLPGSCSSMGFLCAASFLQGLSTCFGVVSCIDCKKSTCFTIVFFMSCRGISVLVHGVLLSLLLLWPQSVQVGFSHIFSLLSHSCCTVDFFIIP